MNESEIIPELDVYAPENAGFYGLLGVTFSAF